MWCRARSFANTGRIESSSSILSLRATDNNHEYKPHSLVLPSGTLCLQPGCLRQLISYSLEEILGLAPDALTEFTELTDVRITAAPNILSHVGNHVAFARSESLPVPCDGPCHCQTGPHKAHYDTVVGHTLVHDFSIIDHPHRLFKDPSLGLTFRPIPTTSHESVARAVAQLTPQIATALLSLSDPVAADSFQLTALSQSLTDQLMSLQIPSRVRKSFVWDQRLAVVTRELQASMLVTCLDKVSRTPCFVCASLGGKILADRLSSSAFEQLTEGEALDIFVEIMDLYEELGIPPSDEPIWAYLYPTLKRHKCMQHSPLVDHECGLSWRFIANCSTGMTSHPLGMIVSAMLSAIKPLVDAHRDSLQEEVLLAHGVTLRFRYSVGAWSDIPLNLPSAVPARTIFITGDVKKCFENIPLDGPDGLSVAIEAYVEEGFSEAGQDMFVPLDEDGIVSGKARFARSAPPRFGRTRSWLCLDSALATHLAMYYSQITILRTGGYLVRQGLGIPMGGPPCGSYCDLFLDHWEYGLALRIKAALAHSSAAVRRHARFICALLIFLFRYADDLMALADPKFITLLMNPASPRSPDSLNWLYPLRGADGDTILEFEAEPAAQMPDGSTAGHFLCLTISLRDDPRNSGRCVTYSPYNVRHQFGFAYPALTRYDSFTPRATLESALSTMVPYAILGSCNLRGALSFLATICERLRGNGYPKAKLLEMWDHAYEHNVCALPCAGTLHAELPELHAALSRTISSLY